MAGVRRIMMVSLGNPGLKYSLTYHSAGHRVLGDIVSHLGPHQPAFSESTVGGLATLSSVGPRYSLFQSPVLMNISGPWVAKAYKKVLSDHQLTPAELGFILVHDDMELDFGMVKIREWDRSARGHNGVKSVKDALKAGSAGKWARVSVGIGRPEARDRESVTDFVLSKMSSKHDAMLRKNGTAGLASALSDLEGKWGFSA
ncbi:9d4fc8dc-fe6e-478d-b7de-a78c6e336fc2 [Thermothielavioides terrestris]|uniref:peptidyl-tRNA hydrolase n=1 Tax=Thermothielavioides terrestris TaxID=2587410 RepID=A0A3S4EX28_9PEZI|nr:9d4fc8dc-fe6e-478d-b7de-a78c6e336fc2 [Thermothielavioides terrestris]